MKRAADRGVFDTMAVESLVASYQTYHAQVKSLDEVIGERVELLHLRGMWDDTFVAFQAECVSGTVPELASATCFDVCVCAQQWRPKLLRSGALGE